MRPPMSSSSRTVINFKINLIIYEPNINKLFKNATLLFSILSICYNLVNSSIVKPEGTYSNMIVSRMDLGDMSRSGKYQYMMKGGQNKYNHFWNFNQHIKNSSVQ